MSLIIYTPSDGAVLRDVLNAMALFMAEKTTFTSGIDIMLTLSALTAVFFYIKSSNVPVLFQWVVNSFCVLYILLGLSTQVNIIDMADEATTYTVAHVPIGVALPASLISSVGYALTKAIGHYFHMPNDVDYNKRGMLFASRIWTGASTMGLKQSPELANDLMIYIDQCIFKSKMLSTKQITADALQQSDDLITLLFTKPSPVYRVILHDGSNLSCDKAAIILKPLVMKAYHNELKDLALVLTKGKVNDAEESYLSAHRYFTGLSQVGAATLTQNILINAVRDAEKNVLAFNGDVAQLMNYTTATTQQKIRYAEANDFWQSEYQLPLIMSSLLTVTLCLFPLIILVSFFPQCQSIYKNYLYTLVYLWTWPMLFNLIHFCVSSAMSDQISLLFPVESIANIKTGITLSNIDLIKSIHSDFALKAGKLTALVPFLAYGIVKGLAYVMNQAAQTFSSQAQGIAAGEAQAAATGNISLGNYSGMNMNYDTANAHKHDTNATFMSGQTSIQGRSGAIEHINTDGSSSFSVGNAISNSAVSVSGTHGLQQSLSHSKEKAQQEMDGYQASFTQSSQSAASHATQFSEAKGHDERLGHGVSSTESANAQSALQRLTHRAADISEKTGVSVDEAFSGLTRAGLSSSAGLDTRRSIPGKFIGFATGAHGEMRFSAGGEQSQTTTARHNSGQNYVVSAREAEDIRHDFQAVKAYASNHHYDTNNSQTENLLIQTSHDFKTIQTASEGYSASLQKSERIADAQSNLISNGAQLSQNLNQEAIKYGVKKVGQEHMRYLEMNPNDEQGQTELTHIKSEFMQVKAQELLNNGMQSLSVNPQSAYQNAKSQMDTQTQGLKGNYEQDARQLARKDNNLGVNAIDKSNLENEVRNNTHQIKTNNDNKGQQIQNQFKHSEAEGQRQIFDGKNKANQAPGLNAIKKYNNPDNKK